MFGIQLDNIDYLSQIYTSQNRIKSAEMYLKMAEKLIGQNGSFSLERIRIYSQFAQLYFKVKNYERASYYLMNYSQLKDSVYNEDMTINLMQAEAQFLERENAIKISSQNELIMLKEEVIRWQKTLNIVLVLLSLLFLVLVVLLFRYYIQKRNISILLERKVSERTRDLQISRDQSVKELQEHALLLSRNSKMLAKR